jgi:hypothetical protein
MALDTDQGKLVLQLLTSRYNDRRWRKKIEKTLSLPAAGFGNETQREIFTYLKQGLKAYKSRRADPDSWIVGGFATQEVIDRAKHHPALIGPSVTTEDVAMLHVDPGPDVDEPWWEEMLVQWFEKPEKEEEKPDEEKTAANAENNPAEA